MTASGTFGRFLLNEYLPARYKIDKPTSKKEINRQMTEFAHEDPKEYVKSIVGMKQVGDHVSTMEGMSIGLDDIEPQYVKRNAIMNQLEDKFNNATTDKQRREIAESAQERMIDLALEHPGTMTRQVISGARGKPFQYSNIVTSPGTSKDSSGDTVPWLITKSYSEGLSPADYWAAGNEAILNTIKSNISVSEPGELSKILINNMADLIVTEDDCGTHNGISKSPNSTNIVDRYLARDSGRFPRNTLITPKVQNSLQSLGEKQILVRSPMTCEASDGVCQKCQGLDEKGNIHISGTNVGIRAAQALSEPMTQMALSTKHGTKTAAGERLQVGGLRGFRQIIESPQQFINKATLAEMDGDITKVEKAPQGGHFVYVNDSQHYVSPNLGISVSKGDTVSAGDVLSQGTPKPDEMVRLKGISAGRLYLVNQLKNIYRDQGMDFDQRHFELLARGELNHARILDDRSSKFIKGDIVNYNTFKSTLAQSAKEVPVEEALGEILGKEYLEYSAGTRITPKILKNLAGLKLDKVYIAPRAPEVEFVMKPATRAPMLNPDWLATLAHRNLKAAIMHGAQVGAVSDIHGVHPIPAFVFGTEFGEGKKGRY